MEVQLNVSVWFFVVLASLMVGSFLNVIVTRLPRMIDDAVHNASLEELAINPGEQSRYDLWLPRSHCPMCHHTLKWHELIPVLSWLYLRGKCSYCKTAISWRYSLVEIAACAIAIALVWQYGLTLSNSLVIVAIWSLFAAAVIDHEHGVLPDSLNYIALWTALVATCMPASDQFLHSTASAVVGAVMGYLAFWILLNVFKLVTKRDGLGYGDIKYVAALGALLGWQLLPLAAIFASVTSLAFGLTLLLRHKYSSTEGIRFGPFLFVSALICALFRLELGFLAGI